jgi:hypothetical protein
MHLEGGREGGREGEAFIDESFGAGKGLSAVAS